LTQPARLFRLADDAHSPGLACDATGLRLAGVALLAKGEDGFSPRAPDEIEALLACAYGEGAVRLAASGLETVARALNQGDLAKAKTAAVFLRLPEPTPNGAARIARADELLAKYSPNQPRDDRGRWTNGDAAASPPPLSTQPGRANSGLGSTCETPVGPPPAGGVMSSDHPTGHVPTGYKVDASHAEEVRRYVRAIVVARQNLNPNSGSYSRDYDNLTQVLDYLDKNRIEVKDSRIPSRADGQADPRGVVELDMDRIRDLASKLAAQNPGSNPDDILAAYGGATLAHEVRHEIDMAQRWRGQMTSDAGGRLSTELNGYSTAFAVYRGLNLTYYPVFTPAMSDEDANCHVRERARDSTTTQLKRR
jgi:hypothetical protein